MCYPKAALRWEIASEASHDEAFSIQTSLAPLNLDYMNRGYFYANSENTGHPGSGPRAEPKLVVDEKPFPKGKLSVTVSQDNDLSFFNAAKGMWVGVGNTTRDTIFFNAQDSCLYMKMQAKDKDGEWRDIEYLPSSWCGNSYHVIMLPPDRYWSFVAPVYEGTFATTMRIALTYIDPSEKADPHSKLSSRLGYGGKRELIMFSGEFNGSVNPGQFWRRVEYSAAGIMDPYEE